MSDIDKRLDEILRNQGNIIPDSYDMHETKQAIKQLMTDEFKKTNIELFNLYGEPRCENLHHPKKWQHKSLDNCPVELTIRQKLKDWKK